MMESIKIMAVLFLLSVQLLSAQSLVAPFSGQLPSENYLQAATLANIPSPGITTAERELLFGPPPPPPTGDGSGGAVGETPVTDCAWILMLCCLMYGFRKRNFMGTENV
jgi:hypothetical protein